MATVKPAEIRAAHAVLSNFIAQQEVLDIFEEAVKDRKTLTKVKRDPAAFLKEKGIKIPAKSEITIVEQRLVVVGVRRLCWYVCRPMRRYVICVQVCVNIPIIVVK